MRPPVIAIDGPSGAGKGTVSRAVAAALGFRYVDTGAMYRAVAWKALDAGIPLDDERAVRRLADSAVIDLSATRVAVDGVDVTRLIRTPFIDQAAASVARLPLVRGVLVARQRQMGAEGGVVMEGRDIGTVVFPEADVKVYLDASPQERARRRAADTAHTGVPTVVSEVATMLTERDRQDTTRAISPLYAAPDAALIDTTGRSVPDVVDEVLRLVRVKLPGAP